MPINDLNPLHAPARTTATTRNPSGQDTTARHRADQCAHLLATDPALADHINGERADTVCLAGYRKPTGMPSSLLYALHYPDPIPAWFTLQGVTIVAVMAGHGTAQHDTDRDTAVWDGIQRAFHGLSTADQGTPATHFALPPEIALLRWEDPAGGVVYATSPRPGRARTGRSTLRKASRLVLGVPAPMLALDLTRRTSAASVAAAAAVTITATGWTHPVSLDDAPHDRPGTFSAPSAPILPPIQPPAANTPHKTPIVAALAQPRPRPVKPDEPDAPAAETTPLPLVAPSLPVIPIPGSTPTPAPTSPPCTFGSPDPGASPSPEPSPLLPVPTLLPPPRRPTIRITPPSRQRLRKRPERPRPTWRTPHWPWPGATPW